MKRGAATKADMLLFQRMKSPSATTGGSSSASNSIHSNKRSRPTPAPLPEQCCPVCAGSFRYKDAMMALHISHCLLTASKEASSASTQAEAQAGAKREAETETENVPPPASVPPNQPVPLSACTAAPPPAPPSAAAPLPLQQQQEEEEQEEHYRVVLGPLPGLYLVPEFVTEEEEAELLRCLDSPEGGGQGPPAAAGAAARAAAGPASPWQHSTFNGNCDSQSFGVITERGADPHVRACRPHHGEREIPPYMRKVILRIQALAPSFRQSLRGGARACDEAALALLQRLQLNEFNANSYVHARGDSLHAHVDDRALSGPLLANLSLLGSCHMRYRHEGILSAGAGGAGVVDVELPPRCLQVVTGEARYNYSHCIPLELLHSSRRVSLTFRQAGRGGAVRGAGGREKGQQALSFAPTK